MAESIKIGNFTVTLNGDFRGYHAILARGRKTEAAVAEQLIKKLEGGPKGFKDCVPARLEFLKDKSALETVLRAAGLFTEPVRKPRPHSKPVVLDEVRA